MPAAEKGTLPFPSTTVRGLPGEAELVMLESVVRPLVANGFEFRGGDVFGQEIVSIYINDNLDEFVMLRFNRPDDAQGRAQPPLIHRGDMAELDQPMDNMDSLRFVTISEFLGKPVEEKPLPAARPAPAFRSAPPRFG